MTNTNAESNQTDSIQAYLDRFKKLPLDQQIACLKQNARMIDGETEPGTLPGPGLEARLAREGPSLELEQLFIFYLYCTDHLADRYLLDGLLRVEAKYGQSPEQRDRILSASDLLIGELQHQLVQQGPEFLVTHLNDSFAPLRDDPDTRCIAVLNLRDGLQDSVQQCQDNLSKWTEEQKASPDGQDQISILTGLQSLYYGSCILGVNCLLQERNDSFCLNPGVMFHGRVIQTTGTESTSNESKGE